MMRKKIIVYTLLGILLVISFIINLWPIQTSHWWDEAVYLQHSEIIFSGRTNYDEFHLRPPMLSIIFAFGYLFKHHMFTASIITALLGTIGVLFTFLVGKELYNEGIGILSALFLGLSPFMVTASHWIMTDIPLLTFITISFYFSILAIKKQSNWLLLFSGIFLGVSILTRFTSLVLIFIIPLYLLINKIQLKKLLMFGYGLLIMILPYLVWAQIKYGFFLLPFINANMAVSDNVGGALFYLVNILAVYPIIILLGILICIIYQLQLVKPSIFKKPHKLDLVLWLWAVLFLLYISVTPHKEIRYVIPIALPLYLLSAKGYYILIENKKPAFKIVAILFILIISIGSFIGAFSRLNEQFINTQETSPVKVSDYLKSLSAENKIIYANNDYPIYAYYTNMAVVKIEQQDKIFYSEFPNNMPNSGFFIYYRDIPKEPNYEWLESNEKFKKIKEIDSIVIYEYSS